jgi:V/A-type H+-transporting ATPase subunit I
MKYRYISDSHVHSDCSRDANDPTMMMCESAARLGLYALTITDHCECNAYVSQAYDRSIRQSYFEARKASAVFNNRLHIYAGVEIGQPMQDQTAAEDLLEACDFDFALASVHNLKSNEDLHSYVNFISGEFTTLQSERADAQQKIQQYTAQIENISHFIGLDLNLDEIRECSYIKVRFGALPRESYDKLEAYRQNPYVIFFPCTSDAIQYWGVYFSPIDMVSEVDRIFSSLYFERSRLAELTGSPETAVETLRGKLSAEKEKSSCQKVYSWLTEQFVYFGIRRYAARYNDNFILTGWIPADKENYFKKAMDKIESIECTFEGAQEELIHSPPVKLKNKGLFRPFEFFVDLYGLPSYDEVDPTPFVALTYILLFGIMFGDLGQGICVSVIGLLMWKYKKMPLGKILISCGISSSIFGLIFGSVFGYEHVLDPLYKGLLGLSEKPVEVMHPDTTNIIILSAVGIGIALVMIAMLINIYSSLKRKHYENALFGPNGVAGLVFYGSLVVGFGGQLLFQWHIVNMAYTICFILLPLLVIMFREVLGGLVEHRLDWKPESWGSYIVQEFFELFEFLLSYASNTISFLRVGAFVLVHAGMMMVVFTLAEMTGGVFYVLVVVIGNIFVMALEGLLVGIQVLRLEFYEMFSRFFEGDGRPFNPVVVRREQ